MKHVLNIERTKQTSSTQQWHETQACPKQRYTDTCLRRGCSAPGAGRRAGRASGRPPPRAPAPCRQLGNPMRPPSDVNGEVARIAYCSKKKYEISAPPHAPPPPPPPPPPAPPLPRPCRWASLSTSLPLCLPTKGGCGVAQGARMAVLIVLLTGLSMYITC